jgi:hypothetical protein
MRGPHETSKIGYVLSRLLACHVDERGRQCKTLQDRARSGKSFLVSLRGVVQLVRTPACHAGGPPAHFTSVRPLIRHVGPGDLLGGRKAKTSELRTKRKVARPVSASRLRVLTRQCLNLSSDCGVVAEHVAWRSMGHHVPSGWKSLSLHNIHNILGIAPLSSGS